MRLSDDIQEQDLSGLPRPGEIFDGKYRIEKIIGVGGMGAVLSAIHLRLEERVALKLLLPQWAQDQDLVRRFVREGQASIKIRSEHVVRVLDVGLVNEQPYLVLEYLEGSDFAVLIHECGPLAIADAVDCLLQACEALAEAHTSGIVHRDLKPANLFLTHRADGSPCVKVLDFGISKLVPAAQRISRFQTQGTLPNTVMGSPPYMSPEQMQSSKDADERSDIWSIGAIMFEMVTGRPPFEAETITALCARILRDPPPPLAQLRADVPPGLESAVLRCLQKEPRDRFANVAELAKALAAFGSPSAVSSAERISRIVEGGIDVSPSSRVSPPAALHGGRINAAELLENSVPPTPLRSPIPGYLLAAAAFLALGAGIGWMVVRQDVAVHDAAAKLPWAEQAAPVPVPLPASPSSVPVIASAVPAPLPVSRLTTTSALATGAASPAKPSRPPAVAAAPVVATPPVPAPAKPPRRHHVVRRADPLPPEPSVRTPPDIDNPYASGSESASPPPSLSAPSPPTADPTELFEGRK